MYHTVTPPYSVIQGGTDKPAENPNCSWGYDTRDPKYRKFIDIMGADVIVANPGKRRADETFAHQQLECR